MRVAIDAIPLLIRSAGVKNYLYYWIRYLRELAADEIRTVPDFAWRPLEHERSQAARWPTLQALAWRALANYTPLPVLQRQARGADVFHATNLTRRPPRGPKLTATIHDLTSWTMPALHARGNVRADRAFASLLERADALIAVSQNTKNDAVRVLGLKPEKITVIHSGIAPAFFAVTPEAVAAVRARYRLERPFLLSVGTIEPRKNVDGLVRAYRALPPSLRQQFDLVLGGPMGWAAPETAALVHSVRYLGYVPESDLPPLTAAAALFAYPSFYEGFGFPVAQAMAAGTAVVTSNTSSLPEIAGDAAILVDPHSERELRDALERMLLSAGLRDALAARGRHRAAQFHWEECARRSLDFFRSAASPAPPAAHG